MTIIAWDGKDLVCDTRCTFSTYINDNFKYQYANKIIDLRDKLLYEKDDNNNYHRLLAIGCAGRVNHLDLLIRYMYLETETREAGHEPTVDDISVLLTAIKYQCTKPNAEMIIISERGAHLIMTSDEKQYRYIGKKHVMVGALSWPIQRLIRCFNLDTNELSALDIAYLATLTSTNVAPPYLVWNADRPKLKAIHDLPRGRKEKLASMFYDIIRSGKLS